MMKKFTSVFLRMKYERFFSAKDLQPKERVRQHEHGGGAYPARSITTCTTKISHRFARIFDDRYSTRLTRALRRPVCRESRTEAEPKAQNYEGPQVELLPASRTVGRCPQTELASAERFKWQAVFGEVSHGRIAENHQ